MALSGANPAAGPLDAVQLSRIEALHRGFLYQHLYAVACLLTPGTSASAIISEFDEDVQVIGPAGCSYFQVKTRLHGETTPSDVAGVADRFSAIRAKHVGGERSGNASFYLIANRPPSASLTAELAGWPSDAHFVAPGGDAGAFPSPWPDVRAALLACSALAGSVPFTRLSPESLVWKLAAVMMYVSSGRGGGGSHEIELASLGSLCEQFIGQCHALPASASPYRAMATKFELPSSGAVIIEGLPGSGKSSFSAEVARHCPFPAVYVDAADTPTDGFVPALVREVCATTFPRDGNIAGTVFATGLSGFESLAVLARFVSDSLDSPILLMIDNAHAARTDDLVRAVGLTHAFIWLILGHPTDALAESAARLQLARIPLEGWTEDSIAAELLATGGCRYTPASISRLRKYTEGNPLFTKNVIRIALSDSEGSIDRALDALDSDTNISRTTQERVLGRVVAGLSESGKLAMAILSLSDLPIGRVESASAAAEAGLDDRQLARALRELTDWSIVETFDASRVRVRDAYQPSARECRDLLTGDQVRRACLKLAAHAWEAAQARIDPIRNMLLHLRMLAQAGEIEQLVEIATSDDEAFIEVGMMPELVRLLRQAAEAPTLPSESRFFALDTLAFWALHAGDVVGARALIDQMDLIVSAESGTRVIGTLGVKRLLLAGKERDYARAKREAARVLALPGLEATWRRIVAYNLATVAFECGEYDADSQAFKVSLQYFDALDLDPTDLLFGSLATVARTIGEERLRSGDLKRLADSLDLHAIIQSSRGRSAGLSWLHAFKLYALSGAYSSAVRVGKEVVDDFIKQGDAQGARRFMEQNLMPAVVEFRFTHETVPIRAQHAVVLAYCGEVAEARREIRDLAAYREAVPEFARRELQDQAELIEHIAAGRVRLRPMAVVPPELQQLWDAKNAKGTSSPPGPPPEQRRSRISRNRPCPCGSGRKYKGCCGKS